jgi:hypothetical protein
VAARRVAWCEGPQLFEIDDVVVVTHGRHILEVVEVVLLPIHLESLFICMTVVLLPLYLESLESLIICMTLLVIFHPLLLCARVPGALHPAPRRDTSREVEGVVGEIVQSRVRRWQWDLFVVRLRHGAFWRGGSNRRSRQLQIYQASFKAETQRRRTTYHGGN